LLYTLAGGHFFIVSEFKYIANVNVITGTLDRIYRWRFAEAAVSAKWLTRFVK